MSGNKQNVRWTSIELKIAICDDEKYYREHIKEIVEKCLDEKNIIYDIVLFKSGVN